MAVARVPPEIWADIFVKHSEDQPSQRIHPLKAPLVFTLVCRKWRATAYSTPMIWTKLRLPEPPKNWTSLRSFTSSVALWMKCSEPYPIARLEVRGLKDMPTTFLRPYLTAMVSHSRRWERVWLPLDDHDLSFFDGLSENAFPLLKKFHLTDARGPVTIELSRALQNATKLRELTLGHPILDDSWTLPWAGLDTLSLSSAVVDEKTMQKPRLCMNWFVSAMCSSIRLDSLSLKFSPGFSNPELATIIASAEQVTLPDLRYLEITMDPALVAIFADTLILPHLDTLSLYTENQPWEGDAWDTFMEFTNHFSTTLDDLLLCDSFMDSLQIIELLRNTPMLSHLEIANTAGIGDWDTFFICLTFRFGNDGQLLWSSNIHLTEIVLERPKRWSLQPHQLGWPHDWSYNKLVAMLESRRHVKTNNLESFSLLVTDKIRMQQEAPGAYARLMRLAEDGLKVKTTGDPWENMEGSDGGSLADASEYSSDELSEYSMGDNADDI